MTDPSLLPMVFSRASAAFQQGDLAGARAGCEEILAVQRSEPNALRLLAKVCIASGEHRDAIGHLTTIVKRLPKEAEFRTMLGQQYVVLREYAKALAQFEKALRLDPRDVFAAAGKAETLEHQGKHDRARRVLAPFVTPDTAPDPAIASVWMRLLARDRLDDEVIEFGRRVVDDTSSESMPESMMVRDCLFEIARAHERRAEYDEAFATAARANAMCRRPFDPDEHDRVIDRLIGAFQRERVAAVPRPEQPSELPILIVGLPRSGSTLVERILHAHPAIHGAGEIDALPQLVATMATRFELQTPYADCIDELRLEHVTRLAADYVGGLRQHHRQAARIVDKNLENLLHLGVIAIALPRARVIHCRRDTMDNCLSCWMERLRPAHVPYTTDLTHLGQYARAADRLMAHWHSALDLSILDLQYESLVADLEGESRRLIEFCGLEWNDACLRYHESKRLDGTLSYDQVRRPIYASSIGRADRFGALLDPLRRALAE